MLQRHRHRLILGLALLLPVAMEANAEVFKCVGEDGQITFAQTPCPPKVSEVAAEPQTIEVEAAAPAESLVASATQERRVQKELAPAVAEARARAAQAHEELKRRQCEANLRAQIDSINLQIRDDRSTARSEALRKKRGTLQARLSDC